MMRRLVVATLMFSMVFLGSPLAGVTQSATADQYVQYGNKLYMAKDYANAAKYYQAAVQVNPNSAQTYQVLGNCLFMTNRKAEAVAAYEKSLSLNPNNPQLAAYVQNLKNQVGATTAAPAAAQPAASAAPSVANAGMQALQTGAALFKQKNFAAAIPYFQQAETAMPTDYRPSYYLGYAQYMTRDMKNAAVNFAKANQKQPNATLKAYADRIKASLPAADQQWVDAQVAGGAAVKTTAVAGAKKASQYGFRPLFGIALASLGDLNDDGDFQETYAKSHGYKLTGQVPKGNVFIGMEPFFRPSPAIEVALGFGLYPVGKYNYTCSGWTAIEDGAPGYGTPNSPATASADDQVLNEMKLSTAEISLTARYYVGKGRAKGVIGAGIGYYPASIKLNRSVIPGETDMAVANSYTGTFKKSGIGEHVLLGGSFNVGGGVSFDPYVMYRIAKLKDFTGTLTDNRGKETTGTLSVWEDSATKTKGIGVDDGTTLPSTYTARPLELDLSGVQFGFGVAFSF